MDQEECRQLLRLQEPRQRGQARISWFAATRSPAHQSTVHDSQVFDELLDPENTNVDVWADSAYRSAEQEASLTENGYRSHINKKGKRNNLLSKATKAANRRRSTVRSRVEHVFGAMEAMGGMVVRTIGRARAGVKIGLMNIAYNVKRFAYLQEHQA